MSKINHTPGPWEFQFTETDGMGTIFITAENAQNATIVLNAEQAEGDEPGQIEANARVIASAPDLLEALKEIRRRADGDDWRDCEDVGQMHSALCELENIADKAIKKSETKKPFREDDRDYEDEEIETMDISEEFEDDEDHGPCDCDMCRS